MHSVFLVEDEPRIRQSIRNVLEKHSDRYTCVGESSDGELAISIVRDVKPDILITDIKMPFMDGLTLARHAKAIVPWIRIIIISGYDDFELAQQAISVGVDRYLLKPVAREELLAALSKADELIIEYRKSSAAFLTEASNQERVKNALVSSLLEQLCGGEISADETLHRADELGIDILSKVYAVLIMSFEHRSGIPNRSEISVRIKCRLADAPDLLYFFSGVDQLVIIVKGEEDIDVTEKAYHLAQTIKHEVELDQDTLASASISSVTNRLSSIRDAYHESCILLKTFGPVNLGRIIRAGDIGRLPGPRSALPDRFYGLNIENTLKFAVAEDVPEIVAEFGATLRANEMHSILYRYYILMDLTNSALRIIHGFQPDWDEAQTAENFAGLRQLFRSAMTDQEFTDLATKICLKTIELRDRGSSSHHVKLVRRACQYIQEHYNHPDISLNSVAAHVSLSPAHFSTIFAQEMSVTFIDHLTNVRLEKVKEILSGSDEKIVNIAFAVGYSEPNYLSYLFKKRTGLTPKEYRQRQRNPHTGSANTIS